MGARASALALLGLACGLARSASAQPLPPIAVERTAGAEGCPDTDDLTARVAAILGHDAVGAKYEVTFSRSSSVFNAAIRAAADGATVRYLYAKEPTCAALAHATAVALAVLFDADVAASVGEAEPLPAPAPPPPVPKRPVQLPLGMAPPRHGERLHVAAVLSLGAAGLVGVLRPIAPAYLADAGLSVSRFRVTLGVLWATPQTLDLPPGTARESVLSGTLRACYEAWRGAVFGLAACSGVLVGAASAEARGFATNDSRTGLFLAFPVEVAVRARTGALLWELGASALVLAPPNEFRIEGKGPTYRPAPVAGLFTLRIVFAPE
jgi:hypothetical protein